MRALGTAFRHQLSRALARAEADELELQELERAWQEDPRREAIERSQRMDSRDADLMGGGPGTGEGAGTGGQ